jgi:hypothetical protein
MNGSPDLGSSISSAAQPVPTLEVDDALYRDVLEEFEHMDIYRWIDGDGVRGNNGKFKRCAPRGFMFLHILRKVHSDCLTVPGWLERLNDMFLKPAEYSQEGACPSKGLTSIPIPTTGSERPAMERYAYESCASRRLLCIRLVSMNATLALAVFPLEELAGEDKYHEDLAFYVRRVGV